MSKYPMQPVEKGKGGAIVFRGNPLVRFLLDAGPLDLNQLFLMPVSDKDREHFMQLIGYTVDGYAELDFVSDRSIREALEAAEPLRPKERNPKST